MPTQKQISAAIDAHLAKIQEGVDLLVARSDPLPTDPPKESPPVTPPVVTPPVVTQPPPVTPGASPWTRARPFVMPAIIRTPQEIVASKLVLPYDARVIEGRQAEQSPNVPGDWPGADFMGATGEREDIGPVIEDAAIWLVGQSSPSDMIIWGETHGLVPVHFRLNDQGQPDPLGKNPVDVFKYPSATCYEDFRTGSPHFPVIGPIQPEAAHYPSAAYVPYLATGDLYYLQEVQDAATFMMVSPPPGWGRPPGGVPEGQVRAYAWGLNLVVQAYLATKEAEKLGPLPAPLLPSSYWAKVLDVNRARFKQITILGQHRYKENAPPDPLVAMGFMQPDPGADCAFWQQDMLGAVIGWMVWRGEATSDPVLASWRENYDWIIRQAIIRTSGDPRFPRTRAVQYAVKVDHDPANCDVDGNHLALVTSWAELVALNGYKETADGKLGIPDQSYAAYLRGNLSMAVRNRVSQAAESLAFVDEAVTWVPTKWAV